MSSYTPVLLLTLCRCTLLYLLRGYVLQTISFVQYFIMYTITGQYLLNFSIIVLNGYDKYSSLDITNRNEYFHHFTLFFVL